MNPEDFKELLKALRSENQRKGTGPWKTREGAAEYLGVSVKQIARLQATGDLKPRYVGESPRFHVDDLEAVIREKPYRIAEAA